MKPRIAAFGAMLSALLLVAPAEAALSSARLLARYQPVQVLHPDEAFQPVAVSGFLRTAVLVQARGRRRERRLW